MHWLLSWHSSPHKLLEAGVDLLVLLTSLQSKLQPEFISHADSFVTWSTFCLATFAAVKACMALFTWKVRSRRMLQQSWKVSRYRC